MPAALDALIIGLYVEIDDFSVRVTAGRVVRRS
jgi:hypothetical protein